MENNQPLYVLAQEGKLGPLEKMDQETLDWIKNESAKLDLKSGLTFEIPNEDMDMVKAYFPRREWFLMPDHYESIHGASHISRVVMYTYLVCKQTGVTLKKEYLLAATVHDLRRENDNKDEGHGRRAAEWLWENWDNLGELTAGINKDSGFEMIEAAITYHEADYSLIPVEIDSKFSTGIDILKTADALDRFRQPKEKWWPNPVYFRLAKAGDLMGTCREVTLSSEQMILSGKEVNEAVTEAMTKQVQI